MSDLTPAGEIVRARSLQPDEDRAINDPVRQSKVAPCCREHVPGRVCVLPEGHEPVRYDAPPTLFEGTDETLELPGVMHVLRAHRDQGLVTLEAWSPVIGDRSVYCYVSIPDRRALAAFLLKDLT